MCIVSKPSYCTTYLLIRMKMTWKKLEPEAGGTIKPALNYPGTARLRSVAPNQRVPLSHSHPTSEMPSGWESTGGFPLRRVLTWRPPGHGAARMFAPTEFFWEKGLPVAAIPSWAFVRTTARTVCVSILLQDCWGVGRAPCSC